MISGSAIEQQFPPSPSCSCEICKSYCIRPGWWSLNQAKSVIKNGYSGRMMLEISPGFRFAVLSPAFKGCEGFIAVNECSRNGCTFFCEGLCQLHNSDKLPIECAVCHHDRPGIGPRLHLQLEKQWNSKEGKSLVIYWMKKTGFYSKLNNYCFQYTEMIKQDLSK